MLSYRLMRSENNINKIIAQKAKIFRVQKFENLIKLNKSIVFSSIKST